jgi:hypothetical protein
MPNLNPFVFAAKGFLYFKKGKPLVEVKCRAVSNPIGTFSGAEIPTFKKVLLFGAKVHLICLKVRLLK